MVKMPMNLTSGKATIEATIENVISDRSVGRSSGGKAGIVYVPKEWIGQDVYVVLKGKE